MNSIIKSIIFILFYQVAWPLLSQEIKPLNQTIIQEEKLNTEANTIYVKEPADDQTLKDTTMLYHIPGLTLIDNGGGFAFSSLSLRGL